MKIKAHKRAELFNPQEPKDVHHIFPKSLAKKYNLPSFLVKTDDNAIALEKRTFHLWVHGGRIGINQLVELLDNAVTELEKQIDDDEIEWKGFEEEDYIFLAITLLGIDEYYFSEQRVYKKPRKPKKRRRR